MKKQLPQLLFIALTTWNQTAYAQTLTPLTPKESQAKQVLLQLVAKEDQEIVRGNKEKLASLFTQSPTGQDGLHQAISRLEFLKAWSKIRNIPIRNVHVTLRTPLIRFHDHNEIRFYAVVSERYDYGQNDHFGLGIRHWYRLKNQGHGWQLDEDDFTDPLDQDTRIPGSVRPANQKELPKTGNHVFRITRFYHPRGATAWADTYCGAAPGCGHQGHYHPKYVDYNGVGGDCTNYVSQALHHGGKLQTTAQWSYNFRTGEGTHAWANARGLASFLRYSGRAKVIAVGRFNDLTKPTPSYPRGAINALQAGDLIAYEEKGNIVHFSLVVGFDHQGYLVVDSHTADRYHVPWDIGWDQKTRYWLFQML